MRGTIKFYVFKNHFFDLFCRENEMGSFYIDCVIENIYSPKQKGDKEVTGGHGFDGVSFCALTKNSKFFPSTKIGERS